MNRDEMLSANQKAVHPPAVPEGQGEDDVLDGSPLRYWGVSVSANGEHILSINKMSLAGKEDLADHELDAIRNAGSSLLGFVGRKEDPGPVPASPTPAIERGEEEPWFVVRNWSDGCEKCPDIYSGKQWIATVVGAPHLGHDSLERAELIVKAVNAYRNAPTPTPSAGQEEDDRFIEEEQTVLRLHDKEVTARWVDGVRSELGGDGSLVYLVRLLQKELADLRRQVADDDRLQCCNGCRHYTGGDVRHHPSCKWYPESLTKMQDQQEDELTRLRGEVERLTSIKRLLLHVLNGMMEVETNDWVVQQAATAISNAAMIDSGTYRPGSFMPTGSEGGVK